MDKYCILNAGPVDEGFQHQFGDYAKMFVDAFGSPCGAPQFVTFDVYKGVFPQSVESFSVIFITGSRHGAHEDLLFIHQLSDLIRTIFTNHPQKKLIGICFGHQLIAHSLGGVSAPSPDHIGWELGLKELKFHKEALRSVFSSLPDIEQVCCSPQTPLKILEVHRDQVKSLPPNATLLASSSRTPFEVYAIGNQVLCFQGHPEFSPAVVKYLLGTKEALKIVSSTVDLGSPNNDIFVRLISTFTQASQRNIPSKIQPFSRHSLANLSLFATVTIYAVFKAFTRN